MEEGIENVVTKVIRLWYSERLPSFNLQTLIRKSDNHKKVRVDI